MEVTDNPYIPDDLTACRDGSLILYYGATAETAPLLPIGTVFGCVYSPNVRVPEFAYWRFYRFEIARAYNRIHKRMERVYVVNENRHLADFEIEALTEVLDAVQNRADRPALAV